MDDCLSVTLSPEDEAYFHEFGGTALGAKMATDLCARVKGMVTPKHVVVRINGSGEIDSSDVYRVKLKLLNETVVVKMSGANEDFSGHAAAGANTSRHTPLLSIDESFSARCLEKHLPNLSTSGATCKAIVIQQFVSASPASDSIIVHVTDDEVMVEVPLATETILLRSRAAGHIIQVESSRQGMLAAGAARQKIIRELLPTVDLHWQIGQQLPFLVNTEGFLVGEAYTIVQLRPIPEYVAPNRRLSDRLASLCSDRYEHVHRTSFVRGSFDIVSRPLWRLPSSQGSGAQILLWDRSNLPWRDDEVYRQCLVNPERTPQVVLLDIASGTRLSHHPQDLPPAGELRDGYKYIAASPLAHRLATSRHRLRVLSDGESGIVCAWPS